jgi:hypothetical protein
MFRAAPYLWLPLVAVSVAVARQNPLNPLPAPIIYLDGGIVGFAVEPPTRVNLKGVIYAQFIGETPYLHILYKGIETPTSGDQERVTAAPLRSRILNTETGNGIEINGLSLSPFDNNVILGVAQNHAIVATFAPSEPNETSEPSSPPTVSAYQAINLSTGRIVRLTLDTPNITFASSNAPFYLVGNGRAVMAFDVVQNRTLWATELPGLPLSVSYISRDQIWAVTYRSPTPQVRSAERLFLDNRGQVQPAPTTPIPDPLYALFVSRTDINQAGTVQTIAVEPLSTGLDLDDENSPRVDASPFAVDATFAEVSPTENVLAYIHNQELYLRPIRRIVGDELVALRVERERVQLTNQAKQVGIGIMIYSADYDDQFPGGADIGNALLPYLKNREILKNFTPLTNGESMTNWPADKPIGFIEGRHGRALIMPDSSIRWSPFPPRP